MPQYTTLHWDWKSRPSHEELEAALRPLGVHVYEDPSCKNTDTFGYVFSREPLTEAQLEAIGDPEAGD